MKVYGGTMFLDGIQRRVIVSAKTKKKAIELLNIKQCDFKHAFAETRNVIELRVALSEEETVFYSDKNERNYTKLETLK
ncbi:MAG: hypothetical protein PHO62_07530 [Sulfurimonas sp.]|uniref:hypothetical protein n=1 Tax=Sulfurimonas sp. TaxID=2022749 RepID=UPI00262905C7|nr:hypothetical protein [Sulfurimonas sp.]MDD5373256.1 hypothetical protein [Sulfurimonas sp.]